MSQGQRMTDKFSTEEFLELLTQAEEKASGDWEMKFVSDVKGRHNQYGDTMYLSDKQIAALERIAYAENDS